MLIRKSILGIALGSLALTACDMTQRDQSQLGGALAGAAVGVVTATLFDADKDWVIIAALAGAAVGTMVAQNNQTNQCAYAVGDGTYRILPCP
ncbi:glycine zipper 2TM domain-containing protein [Pseudorhodobacter sp. W20_MBD10_FR17]|uniref:glycine zipper 2TM domain-containing protein n=1 Tax=Pseudorhodobacter sp. W20_MBD10_FR17 TaxID=3240266 RepID=UPI003F99AB54